MRLSAKELISLPVETKSGEKLGKIASFEIDIETQQISAYLIKSSNLIKDLLFQDQLIISPNQVILINKRKMVVEDGVIKEKIRKEINAVTAVTIDP